MDIRFDDEHQWLSTGDGISLNAFVGGKKINIIISREAIEDMVRKSFTSEEVESAFLNNQKQLFEKIAPYLKDPNVKESGKIIIKSRMINS